MNNKRKLFHTLLAFAIILNIIPGYAAEKKKFNFEDVLKFRAIENAKLSEDGDWLIYNTAPDIGNKEMVVKKIMDSTIDFHVERASNPIISTNNKWVAAKYNPDFIKLANSAKGKAPKSGMLLLNTSTGEQIIKKDIASFEFSGNSEWLIYSPYPDKNDKEEAPEKYKMKKIGSELVMHHLGSGTEIIIPGVTEYYADSSSTFIFYARSERNADSDGIYYRSLKEGYCPERPIQKMENHLFSNLTWNNATGRLAYLSAGLQDDGKPYKASLWFWDSNEKSIISAITMSGVGEGNYIPSKNKLAWSEDGGIIFVGTKPDAERYQDDETKIIFNKENILNPDSITASADLDIWHNNDPLIKTNEKKTWPGKRDRFYYGVYHVGDSRFVQLAAPDMSEIITTDNHNYTIGFADAPYLKEIQWDGWYRDLYLVNLKTGNRKLLEKRIYDHASISPLGKFVAYYNDKQWFLYDVAKDSLLNITESIGLPFHDVDWDIPAPAPSYGFLGWFENDDAFCVYDKFDPWMFLTGDGYSKFCMTLGEGRDIGAKFRVIKTRKNRKFISSKDSLYLEAFSEKNKWQGIYIHETWIQGIKEYIRDPNYQFNLLEKVENRDRFLYTRESYDEFPDLWIGDGEFDRLTRVSNLDKQLEPFSWGKAELTSWKNGRGQDLQGVIIKPDNFEEGKKYPVLIYFYERFSDRLHQFVMPRINHRPCYPLYVSDDYIMLLPDIKYVSGDPGTDATDALVRGAQHLIDMGIADPDKIAIQGHSWGGYESAYIVTRTNMFAACCTGAPVGNMTSAYSGIRLGTGLSRQFQYEKWQSRIGGNLWDSLDNYIRNSPVFQARTMNTPMLIMFGDNDEAVPWEQGIELYLAFRRLDKNALMLQYRNEPHHPKKMRNKLDYAIKMKEFFDHYLKNTKMPEWMEKGIPYRGE